jgi:hypothetical protein
MLIQLQQQELELALAKRAMNVKGLGRTRQ